MAIRILLADDHPIVRDGLRAVLTRTPDMQLVGEAGDGLQALQLVESLQPDVLVLDLMMPGLGGLAVTARVKEAVLQTRVVILSMHANEAYVAAALEAGAQAYVLKKSASTELLTAIRAVLAGERFLSPALSTDALEDYQRQGQLDHDRYKTLTPRERQILHLVTAGRTSKQIATQLTISHRTVEMHRANLMRKLGAHSTADLVRYALMRGILPPE